MCCGKKWTSDSVIDVYSLHSNTVDRYVKYLETEHLSLIFN